MTAEDKMGQSNVFQYQGTEEDTIRTENVHRTNIGGVERQDASIHNG